MSHNIENVSDKVKSIDYPIFVRLFELIYQRFKEFNSLASDIMSWMAHFFCEMLENPEIFFIIGNLKTVTEGLI